MTEREERLLDAASKIGASEARRQYYREWRKKNPGKQQEYMQRYWEKKAREQILQNYREASC